MTTNKLEVKRHECKGFDHLDGKMVEDGSGDWVSYEDYEALQAECDRYRNVIVEVTTRQHAERWTKSTSDTELEQYLSDGIAQLEGEHRKQIEALQAECEKLRRAIRRLCNIYVVDDYYDGQLREERLEAAVNRAINAAMETTK